MQPTPSPRTPPAAAVAAAGPAPPPAALVGTPAVVGTPAGPPVPSLTHRGRDDPAPIVSASAPGVGAGAGAGDSDSGSGDPSALGSSTTAVSTVSMEVVAPSVLTTAFRGLPSLDVEDSAFDHATGSDDPVEGVEAAEGRQEVRAGELRRRPHALQVLLSTAPEVSPRRRSDRQPVVLAGTGTGAGVVLPQGLPGAAGQGGGGGALPVEVVVAGAGGAAGAVAPATDPAVRDAERWRAQWARHARALLSEVSALLTLEHPNIVKVCGRAGHAGEGGLALGDVAWVVGMWGCGSCRAYRPCGEREKWENGDVGNVGAGCTRAHVCGHDLAHATSHVCAPLSGVLCEQAACACISHT